MPQFDVSSFTSQLFWLAVVFACLYFLVSKFIAPKAEFILTARNRCLEDNINNANEYSEQAKTLDISRRAQLEEVNAGVEDMLQQAIGALESNFLEQNKSIHKVLDKKREQALAEINEYIDKFHIDEPDHCISLAAFIIQKITNNPADLKLLRQIHGRTK